MNRKYRMDRRKDTKTGVRTNDKRETRNMKCKKIDDLKAFPGEGEGARDRIQNRKNGRDLKNT